MTTSVLWFPIVGVTATSLGLVWAVGVQAQSIVPGGDGTQVMVNGDLFTITGGIQRDQSLFHSFEQFHLNNGQVADFVGNPGLANILGRVTGGSASTIDGLLQVTNSGANLYLMNPAGIVFGPNARLDLAGSFTATTATAIGFENGWFNATGANHYDALVGSPNRFAFSQGGQGTILNEGDLAVNSGQSLTLLGGTVVNTGSLTAPGGFINLKAVPDAGVVRLEQAGMVLSLEIDPLAVDPLAGSLNTLPSTLTPLDLPQLLTGGHVRHATSLVVGSDGSVSLVGSTTPLATGAGDITLAGSVRVDALILGDGGEAHIVAEKTLTFLGNVSARGGDLGGDGGFVDLSGKETLNLVGDWYNRVALQAPQGQAGTLLLDPRDITIVHGTGTDTTNTLYDANIQSLLQNSGSLVITTSPGTGGSGDITGSNLSIIWSNDNNLTLRADRSITLTDSVIKNVDVFSTDPYVYYPYNRVTAGTGNITLEANLAETATGTFSGITLTNTTLETDAGSISLKGYGTTNGILIQSNANGSSVISTNAYDQNITLTGGGGTGSGIVITSSNPGTPVLQQTDCFYVDCTGQLVSTTNLIADTMDLQAAASRYNVKIEPLTSNRDVVLGVDQAGTLSLDKAGMAAFTQGINTLTFKTTGNVTFNNPTFNSSYNTIEGGTNFTLNGATDGNWSSLWLKGSNMLFNSGASIGDGSYKNIILTTNTLNLDAGVINTTGSLTIDTLAGNTTMGIGSAAAGTLSLSDTELSKITGFVDNLTFGNASSGTVTVKTFPWAEGTAGDRINNLAINSGNNIDLYVPMDLGASALTLVAGNGINVQSGANLRAGNVLLASNNLDLQATLTPLFNLTITSYLVGANLTTGTSIGLGDTATGTLHLTDAELARIIPGFGNLTLGGLLVGETVATGAIDIQTFPFTVATTPTNLNVYGAGVTLGTPIDLTSRNLLVRSSAGITVQTGGNNITATNATLVGDAIDLQSQLTVSGNLTLDTYTNGTNIALGSGASLTTGMLLDDGELGRITTGFDSLVLGHTIYYGTTPADSTAGVEVKTNPFAGTDLTVTGQNFILAIPTDVLTKNFNVNVWGDIDINAALTSSSGNINLTAQGDLSVVAPITSTTGS
ncbi:MAG: filamentous hemagglutinin N-terminal domain-containing protein, partial [Prochlorothrix sp.]|nr:filamentous hemagglutinin N-terminal domain-containing protein [Prochlorothrix sp.]